jgi:hypothetical protein
MPLLYGAISKKTVFNFRAWDNRLLTLSPVRIWIGKQSFDTHDIQIDLQIHAYDGFVYHIRKEGLLGRQSTFGNGNTLLIQHKGSMYDVEFHLRDYESYTTLCTIADEWKARGVRLVVKEIFTREFVKKQYARQQRKKK